MNLSQFDEKNYFNNHDAFNKGRFMKYIYGNIYFVNIASSAGYENFAPINDTERIIYVIYTYLGGVIFALLIAYIQVSIELYPEVYQKQFESISQISKANKINNIPKDLDKRINKYLDYQTGKQKNILQFMNNLVDCLPENQYTYIQAEQLKTLLKKFPIFKDFEEQIFYKAIVSKLKSKLFLKNDYIIYKDDIGEEMFFIIEGSVSILTPDERQVIVVLEKGSFFGEIALFSDNPKRTCSCVAATFCEVYVLFKNDLDDLSNTFPLLKKNIQKECDKRILQNEKTFQNNEASQKSSNLLQVQGTADQLYESKMDTYKLVQHDNNFNNKLQFQDQYVSEDELEDNSENIYRKNKQSKRILTRKTAERRYSRIELGKEFTLSKFSAFKLQWKVNKL